MKSNSCVYLISSGPAFDESSVVPVDPLNTGDTAYLNGSLVLNNNEILSALPKNVRLVYCFDERDGAQLSSPLTESRADIVFRNSEDIFSSVKGLTEKYIEDFGAQLFIFSNSIGFSVSDVKKALNLLTLEDETIVVGKSVNDKISFIGFNSFNQALLKQIDWYGQDYDHILRSIGQFDEFLYVLETFMTVKTSDDFKLLYKELSKKESLEYCSQEMHERFTHLFIEYKELLK